MLLIPKMKIVRLLVLVIFPILVQAQSSVLPENLRCEYLENPQGIDEIALRLSWTLSATNKNGFGQKQTAYRILVSRSSKQLAQDKGDQWDSGWVPSSEMQHIVYGGKPLETDTYYTWKVAVKDESGKIAAWSTPANWSMGILKKAEWSAKWIGADEVFDPKQTDCNISDPWFRKVVELKAKPKKAVMFVASVGFHELYVNGKKIGDDVLSSAVTDHNSRARYIAYDIASELKSGKNVIALWLGASWSIFTPYATADKPRAPIVIAQADVYNGEGQAPALRIQTDKTWKTHPSPNKLLGTWDFGKMGGELYDANKEIANWNLVSCDETAWKDATVFIPKLTLSAQMVETNRLFNEIKPIAIEERPDGSYRVDMGVNFAGWSEIKVKGSPGQRIDFLYSEREKEAMTFRNYSAFIIGSSGTGTFRHHFNYGSGRWITIKGLKEKPKLTDIKGWVVRTNYQTIATFQSSDSLQNWIYDRVRWNFENLSLGGYVVDCPQRERFGYGGDAHATSETGMFNYRLGAFYTKWMEDWRDVQGTKFMDPLNYGGNADNGILPHTAPTYFGGGGPAWGGISVTLPWQMYQHEGDKRVLERNFEMIKRWLAFLDSHTQKDNLMVRFGGPWDFLGDWLWPNATAEGMNNDKPENICLNNGYRVYNLRTAAKIGRLLGRNEEAAQWEKEADLSSAAIHQKYFNAGDNSYADSSMGNLAMALLAEVPPAGVRDAVMKRLEKEILVVRKGYIDVGITAGAVLFKLLREMGRDDLLYSMTSKTEYPSWGFMKASGATTLWEMWEKDLPGHSMLHSSFLYPGAWYIDGLAGIHRDPKNPGFRQFIIRAPKTTEKQLGWAKSSFDSPIGTIKSAWERKNGNLKLEVTVPPNSIATVYFPAADGAQVTISSALAKKKGKEGSFTLYELPAGTYTISGKEQ